jgi:hypothetical protein
MSIADSPTKLLERLTYGRDLTGHDRRDLHRMVGWKTKKLWPYSFGPKPGEPGCYVPAETQRLFRAPERDDPTEAML